VEKDKSVTSRQERRHDLQIELFLKILEVIHHFFLLIIVFFVLQD